MNEDKKHVINLTDIYVLLKEIVGILRVLKEESDLRHKQAMNQFEKSEEELKKRAEEHKQRQKVLDEEHIQGLAALHEIQIEMIKDLKELAGDDPEKLEMAKKLEEIIESGCPIKNKSKLQ